MSTFRAERTKPARFRDSWTGWAIVAVAAIVSVSASAYAGVSVAKRTNVAVVSNAQHCANQPTKLASLFSDGGTTMMRLSNPDYREALIRKIAC